MDNSQWVQSRRDMISQYYVLPPEAQQQAEQVFQKMEQMTVHIKILLNQTLTIKKESHI